MVLVPVISSSGQTRESDEASLRYLKTVEWPAAYREQDTVLLDKILADEFQFVDQEGVATSKRFELEYIKKHKPTYQSFVFTVDDLRIFENGTAIITGTGVIKGEEDGKPYVTTYRSSNVLIRRDGQWKAIQSHVSGVKHE